jgi:hypothetical protein
MAEWVICVEDVLGASIHKYTFWAGMNSFFYGYVHSQTTLKEFVDEYDTALRRMVKNV